MKVKMSEIRDLMRFGKQNPEILDKQVSIHETGYYTPSNANWSYRVGIANINGKTYEVATQFGAIVGGRLIDIPKS